MSWLIRYSQRAPEPDPAGEEPEFSFTTPARGDVYDFHVTVHLSCSSRGPRWGGGADRSERNHVRERVRAEVRRIAREHSPYCPEEAEPAVNEALDRLLADTVNDAGARVRWAARAEVGLCDQVRGLGQERARRLHESESVTAEAELRAANTERLRLAWERFLDGAREGRHSLHAVRLAEHPQDVAEVLTRMRDEDEGEAARFLALLDKLVAEHARNNVYDLVVRSDTALREAMRALRLPVPPREADPLIGNGSAYP